MDRCEHLGEYRNINYCLEDNLACAIEREGSFKNVRFYTCSLPFNKTEEIIYCNGVIRREDD